MIRVLLADDQPLIRAGFRVLLDLEDDIEVVGEAADGDEAVRLAAELLPDVALFDVEMPGADGISATRRVCADPALTRVRVVILTNYAFDEYIFDALRAGASGFLVKDTDPADLIRGLRTVAGGEALLAPAVTRQVIAEFVSTPAPQVREVDLDVLTPREREVLGLIGRGMSNEEISTELNISHTTAKTHVSRTMTKLRARDRAQLVVAAYESGLVRARHQ
ncbi:MAG TPA: response regulator transcription factor [Stackebrandtia sp.]|jgi:DNA-binding NarL/FixJ family response regulator|uniref:response regulator transcription factor n=1 Tax=Stackebrandtia sp. TaxID=2023065 RepID=UPI002D2BFBC7|nr:response regulator transcription factor [Stackebrandtia sp.]HZE37314.1 response regulator transcription factor [Stackebrandtia sp.]